jgi:hypothetical protein
MLLEVTRQLFGVVLGPFGHNDNRVRFAAIVCPAQLGGDEFRICLDLGDHNRFSPAGNAGHQRQVTAIASHRLDEKSPLVRRGGDLQPINRFKRDVERGVDADGDLRAVQIIVNRRSHSHDREPHLRDRVRSLL